MDSHFGIGVTPETLSLLKFLGVIPLGAAILASFKVKKNKGMVLGIAWLVYVVYQAVLYFFVYANA